METVARAATFGTALAYLIRPIVLHFNALVGDISLQLQFLLLTAPVFTLVAFLYICFYYVVDSFRLLPDYKLQRLPRMMPTKEVIQRALSQLVFFHFGPRIAVSFLMFSVIPLKALHEPSAPAKDIWFAFAISVIFGEVIGYWTHRVQHEFPFLYRYHKVHHEFKANMAFNAQHFSFVELTFNTVMQHISFVNHGVEFTIVHLLWRSMEEYEAHSGYSFRGTWLCRIGLTKAYHSEFHDFHHSHNSGNFGLNLFMDYWLGTADAYVLHQNKLRKTVLP